MGNYRFWGHHGGVKRGFCYAYPRLNRRHRLISRTDGPLDQVTEFTESVPIDRRRELPPAGRKATPVFQVFLLEDSDVKTLAPFPKQIREIQIGSNDPETRD
jgi:hypothetical protein